MDVRRSLLAGKLMEHGWNIVHREQKELEWWADEIWTVESEWSPKGFQVFLTWLVDPQWDRGRPGEKVWLVGTCLHRPTNHEEAERAPMFSIKHWPMELGDFLKGLDDLRNQALNERATKQSHSNGGL